MQIKGIFMDWSLDLFHYEMLPMPMETQKSLGALHPVPHRGES